MTFSAAGQLRGPRFHGDVPLSERIQLHQNESAAQASGVTGRSPLPLEQTCTGFNWSYWYWFRWLEAGWQEATPEPRAKANNLKENDKTPFVLFT